MFDNKPLQIEIVPSEEELEQAEEERRMVKENRDKVRFLDDFDNDTEEIDLSNIGLEYIDYNFSRFTKLKRLNLSNNAFHNSDLGLNIPPNLILDVSYNNFWYIRIKDFSKLNLKRLILSQDQYNKTDVVLDEYDKILKDVEKRRKKESIFDYLKNFCND